MPDAATTVDECEQRVEAEAILECRCRASLFRMRITQAGIQIDNQRMIVAP